MREFLYKSSFLRYYTALFNRNVYYKKRKMIAVFSIIMYFGIMMSAMLYSTFAIAAFLMFMICAMLASYRRTSPNLTGLMPLTSRRKIIYQFLSPLFSGLLILLLMLLGGLLGYLMMNMYLLLTNSWTLHDPYFMLVWELIIHSLKNGGVHGTTFGIAFLVMCYSAGMMVGFIRKKKFQIIFVVGYLFVLQLALAIFKRVLESINNTNYFLFYSMSPFYESTYANLSNPWIVVTIAVIAAAGMLAAAIYVVCKNMVKKDY